MGIYGSIAAAAAAANQAKLSCSGSVSSITTPQLPGLYISNSPDNYGCKKVKKGDPKLFLMFLPHLFSEPWQKVFCFL